MAVKAEDRGARLGDIEAALVAGSHSSGPAFEDKDAVHVRVGHRLERVQRWLEKPLRKSGSVELHDVKSLIAYTARHRTEATVVYADPSEGAERITAVLDDHDTGEPGFGGHRAIFPCPRTVEWQAWRMAMATAMSQEELVDFFEERALEVVDPPAAELQEMIRDLKVTKEVRWQKAFDERTGKIKLDYSEDVRENADRKGSVELPSHFTIGVPVFKGGEPYRCEVRLRFRLREARLKLHMSIDNVQRIEEVAFGEAVKEVQAGLGETLVLLGKAPPAR